MDLDRKRIRLGWHPTTTY